jgi:hypothetical protein
MAKTYSDRQMAQPEGEREFFFPKHVPPVTIKASSQEEAVRKLEEMDSAAAV